MNDAMVWLGLAGILVILEIFSGTFYLLMIAVGMLAGAMAAWFGLSNPLQMLCVAIVGVTGVLLLRLRRRTPESSGDPSRDPGINLDIGQTVRIDEWSGPQAGVYVARASYRGADWDVELERGAEASPGLHMIRAVQGSRLIVTPRK